MSDVAKSTQELLDRQAIYACLVRYCRGVDRIDLDLYKSAYWPDAVDDHGGQAGPVDDEFFAWGQSIIRNLHENSMHSIANHYCDLEGDVAHCETYFTLISINKPGGKREIRGGRYIDRFEKRNGEWKIAVRFTTIDCDEPDLDEHNEGKGIGKNDYKRGLERDRTDPSYMRPLQLDQKRFKKQAPMKPIDEKKAG